MSAWIWLVIALGFALVEITNMAFFAAFAALGAAAGAAVSAGGGDLLFQILVFAGVSVGGAAVLRRPLVRALGPHGRELKSGVAGLVGEHGTVVTRVEGQHQPGAVHVRGEDWPAITYDDHPYEPGQTVQVLEIEKTKLVVTEL